MKPLMAFKVLYHFDQFGRHAPRIGVVWTKLVSGHRSQPILASVEMWFANWVKKVLNLSKIAARADRLNHTMGTGIPCQILSVFGHVCSLPIALPRAGHRLERPSSG